MKKPLRKKEADAQRGPTAFLFMLVNAGYGPSDYSNYGLPDFGADHTY
jgi:hypothetical protein